MKSSSRDTFVSICIPTYNRQAELTSVLDGLKNQTFKNFEIVLVEGGSCERTAKIIDAYRADLSIQFLSQNHVGLVGARNQAWMKAKGEVLAFIDDDVRPSSRWLEELVNALVTHNDVAGVGGPALISNEDAKSRDLTRFLFGENSVIKRAIREVYFRLFLENKPFLINHFFKSGTFSLGSMIKTVVEANSTITAVDYLDASNMCFRKAALKKHDGFDSSFLGIGDYSEPDLCFRIRGDGGRLVFNPKACVFHHPSEGGIFPCRSGAYDRLRNFVLFHRRHFQANLHYFLYLFFLSSYFLYKSVSAKDRRWLQGVFGIFWKRQN